MSNQFYVSPEQLMKDRADFARKGISRGRSVVVLSCAQGIALVAENPSVSLHKVGEIYDRIAFAAVGKYNEFESLRQAGVRYADVRGYSYDRDDVTARGLASVYAQSLGAVFTAESKPFEVELAVVEVGASAEEDHLYRLTYDGSIADEKNYVVMGGAADALSARVAAGWEPGMSFEDAIACAARALSSQRNEAAPAGGAEAAAAQLEVAVLDRDPAVLRGGRRCFRRITEVDLDGILARHRPGASNPAEEG